jgi:pimeloyl-ACP methyl ester carboxylesterase
MRRLEGPPGEPPALTEHAVTAYDGGVVVRDVGFDDVRAHLVEPPGVGPHAAALYLHWFEPRNPTSSRAEFLDEAVALARRGLVSLLPDLAFPWRIDPVGDERDLDNVVAQTAGLRRCLDLLAGRSDVTGRLAVIGHDYGGMYGLLLAATDRQRIGAVVAMNVDATFGNWFARFFLELGGPETVRYEALLEPVDPIRFVDKRSAPVLFQFSEPDFYVPDSTRRALVSRAAAPKECRLYPGAGHELDDTARADRTGWLAERLGLAA